MTAAATFFAGGTALAASATPSGTPTDDAPPAQSLLTASIPNLFETETENKTSDPVEGEQTGPAAVAPEPVPAVPEPVVAPDPAAAPAPAVGAQGLHGACVSAVAQDKSTVGRDHGAAVSKAAHSCPKDSADTADKADGVDKPEADKPEADKPEADKPEADKLSAAEKSKGGAKKSAAGKSQLGG
ncbi:MAG: hypothetical protein ABI934_08200 [Actinomycetota bacterium]